MPLLKRKNKKGKPEELIKELISKNKYLHENVTIMEKEKEAQDFRIKKLKQQADILMCMTFLTIVICFAFCTHYVVKYDQLKRVAVNVDDALQEHYILTCPSCGSHNCYLNADYDSFRGGRIFEAHCKHCGISSYGYADVDSLLQEWSELDL